MNRNPIFATRPPATSAGNAEACRSGTSQKQLDPGVAKQARARLVGRAPDSRPDGDEENEPPADFPAPSDVAGEFDAGETGGRQSENLRQHFQAIGKPPPKRETSKPESFFAFTELMTDFHVGGKGSQVLLEGERQEKAGPSLGEASACGGGDQVDLDLRIEGDSDPGLFLVGKAPLDPKQRVAEAVADWFFSRGLNHPGDLHLQLDSVAPAVVGVHERRRET